ncbi:MAG: hypothetical protein CMF12_08510 [Idiomarina sp.]|uniref:hypothetical protein n=1 Tax=Idiomarina sp. TaxID=1874361 RepID=UPI000C43A68E|nr:hypothetical protein [Idiomarina sp.]MBT42551.1 hypothetical protein [Idiomarina sp.]|tara:strand:+ start:2649 stop:2939 length:291 start_codon:yes stop_codon:yes gene_type:complete
MRIATYQERLKRITSVGALLKETHDAQRTVSTVRSWVKSQLPPQLRMLPNGSRFVPHLHRKIQQAVDVERRLKMDFYKIKHRLNEDNRNAVAGLDL